MAVSKFHLNLNLSTPPALDDHRLAMPMSRTISSNSMSSVGSVPLTPTGQTIPTPTTLMRLQRLNSSSSTVTTATSDDEDYLSAGLNASRDSFNDWAPVDDDFLLSVYDIHLSNPTIAPFAGTVPPSGVVTRVAKETSKKAKIEGRVFNHSLNAIRKRLLLLCRRQQERSASFSSQTSLPFASGSPKGRRLFCLDDSLDNDEQLPSTPIFKPPHPRFDDLAYYQFDDFSKGTNLDSPLEKMNMENLAVNNWLLNTQSPPANNNNNNNSNNITASPYQTSNHNPTPPSFLGGPDMLPPTPCSPSVGRSQRKKSAPTPLHSPFMQKLSIEQPLASPFREKSTPQTPPPSNFRAASSSQLQFASGVFNGGSSSPTDKSHHRTLLKEVDPLDNSGEDPFPNYTAQRKRNSLNNKRGVRQ